MAIAPVGQMQTAQPFTWGQGGQRLTPEDIALQRRLAAQQMQQGADFSPIGHWSQGLARVAQGLFGGMRERRAAKASEANAAESNAVLQAERKSVVEGKGVCVGVDRGGGRSI